MQIEPGALLAEAQEMALLVRLYEKHIGDLEQQNAALKQRLEHGERPALRARRGWRRIFHRP
jgi:hypothetical protein